MKYTSLLASSAALAALAIVVPVATPASWNLIPAAQADTDINFSIFFNGLGSHGHWVHHDSHYVFVPINLRAGWRPYTDGHWVYARGYGWVWVSDEPFGWATYHYGRWGYSKRIGWFWVPGTRWAPAWVSWRRSGDHIGWAPLPWRGGDDFDVIVEVGSIPDYYWNVVPARSFLSINISAVIIDDDDDDHDIFLRESKSAGSVKVENNIVVNNAIDVNFVEEKSGKDVKEVEVKKTDDPNQAKAGDGEVTAFTGEIKAEGDAKPEKVTKIEEIKNTADVEAGAEAEAGADADVATETDAQGKKKKASESTEADAQAETEAEATVDADADAQAGKKKKASADAEVEAETDANVNAEAEAGKDKKKKASADAEVEAETDANVNAEAQTGKKKKATADEAQASQQSAEETEAMSAEGEAESGGQGKDKKKKQPEVTEETTY